MVTLICNESTSFYVMKFLRDDVSGHFEQDCNVIISARLYVNSVEHNCF